MQMFSWDLLWHSDSIVLGISCIVLAFENKKVLLVKICHQLFSAKSLALLSEKKI